MKKFIVGSIILGILILLYLVSPYYCVYKLFISLKEGDRYKLESCINFDSVRSSLKEQINAKLIEELARDSELQDNPFAGLAMMFMPKLVDYLLDAYLTPAGITTLIGKGRLEIEHKISELQKSVPTETGSNEGIDFWHALSYADYAFFTNPSTFLIEIKGVRLKFKLQEWSWKLTHIYLPDEAIADRHTVTVNPTKLLRKKLSDQTESPYWMKVRAANVRSGPSTNNSIISTLKKGDKVYLISQRGKWCEVMFGKRKENVGWIHFSLLSEFFIEPAATIEIVGIDTKVTEANDVWWKYAWRLTIRNSGSSPVSLTAIIEFQDKDGFIIEKDVEYNLYIPSGKVKTFADFTLIDADVANNVSQIGAKVR